MIAVALVIFCCGLWAAMQCANHAFGSKGAGTALGIGCMLVPVGILAAGLVVLALALAAPMLIPVTVLIAIRRWRIPS